MRELITIELDLDESITEHVNTCRLEDLVEIAEFLIKDCGNKECNFCNKLKSLIKEYEQHKERQLNSSRLEQSSMG